MNTSALTNLWYQTRLNVSRKLNWPLVKPGRINLCVNDECQLNCIMCDRQQISRNLNLSWEQMKKIMDDMCRWRVPFLDLVGGEPLLYPHIIQTIRYAREHGLLTEIDTNGALPASVGEEARAAGMQRFVISLDGASAAVHDLIRGVPGTFDKVMDFISALNRNRSRPEDPPLIILTCTVMNQNLEELPGLIDFVVRQHLSGIFFLPVTRGAYQLAPAPGFQMPKTPTCWIPPDRYPFLEEALDVIIASRKKSPWPVHNTIANLEAIKDYFRLAPTEKAHACFAGFKCLHVSSEGFAGSCGTSFGSIDGASLRQLWYSKRAWRCRREIAACRRPCMVADHVDVEARIPREMFKAFWRDLRTPPPEKGTGN